MSNYFVEDIGTVVLVDMVDDISAATVYHIKVKKPGGGQSVQWTATIDGTTKLKHITAAGDFSAAGEYQVQGYVKLPDWEGHGDIDTFTVKDHL